jgi:hypothetical protein
MTRSPGRPRSACNDEQAEWIRELKRRNPEYGYARLAEITGLNRDTVRRVLGRKKPS